MRKGDFAYFGGLLAIMLLAVMVFAHYSEPVTAGPQSPADTMTVPPPVQTYPPFTLTPWCVSAKQYAEFRAAYGTVDGPWWNNQYVAEYDFDRDGAINILDFMTFRQIYGTCN